MRDLGWQCFYIFASAQAITTFDSASFLDRSLGLDGAVADLTAKNFSLLGSVVARAISGFCRFRSLERSGLQVVSSDRFSTYTRYGIVAIFRSKKSRCVVQENFLAKCRSPR